MSVNIKLLYCDKILMWNLKPKQLQVIVWLLLLLARPSKVFSVTLESYIFKLKVKNKKLGRRGKLY